MATLVGLQYQANRETARHNRAMEDSAQADRDSRERINTQTLSHQAEQNDLDRLSRESIASLDRASRENVSLADRTSRESIAAADRSSRESVAAADRLSREQIADLDRAKAIAIADADRTSRETLAANELKMRESIADKDRDSRYDVASLQTGGSVGQTILKSVFDIGKAAAFGAGAATIVKKKDDDQGDSSSKGRGTSTRAKFKQVEDQGSTVSGQFWNPEAFVRTPKLSDYPAADQNVIRHQAKYQGISVNQALANWEAGHRQTTTQVSPYAITESGSGFYSNPVYKILKSTVYGGTPSGTPTVTFGLLGG